MKAFLFCTAVVPLLSSALLSDHYQLIHLTELSSTYQFFEQILTSFSKLLKFVLFFSQFPQIWRSKRCTRKRARLSERSKRTRTWSRNWTTWFRRRRIHCQPKNRSKRRRSSKRQQSRPNFELLDLFVRFKRLPEFKQLSNARMVTIRIWWKARCRTVAFEPSSRPFLLLRL